MGILTISRQIGSLGDEIAEEIKDQIGFICFDKTSIENELNKYELNNIKIDRFDEKKPSFWNVFLSDKNIYLHFLKSAMYDLILEGNSLIIGRGGSIILKDLPGIIKVQIISTMNTRIDRIRKQFGCDEKTAESIIKQSDHERSGYYKYFFNIDWCCNESYDLILNTNKLKNIDCINIIKTALDSVNDEYNLLKSSKTLTDLILSQKVITKLLYDEKLPIWFLDVKADDGNVNIKGSVSIIENIDLCKKAAYKVEGVKNVIPEIDVLLDFKKRLT